MIQIKSNIFSDGKYLRYMIFDKDRFMYVGNDFLRNVKTIDFSDKYIYPGFIDSHTHLLWYGMNLVRCNLFGVTSEDEIYEKIKNYISDNPLIEYVIAEGFDESTFAKPSLPSRKTLDRIFGKIPIIVKRICGHVAVLNTESFNLLKKYISENYESETGILREGIVLSLNSVLKPKMKEKLLAMKEAQRKFFSLGITSIGDMGTSDSLDIYKSDELILDVFFYYPANYSEKLIGWKNKKNVKLKGLKLFTDGSIGGHTAAIYLPYKNTDSTGNIELSDDDFKLSVSIAKKRGYQLAIHAIGDRAIDFALKHIEKRTNDRIEHFELASREQILKTKKQKVFLSMQPNFIGNWSMKGQMYEMMLDKRYFKFNNSVNIISKESIPMGFGSDCMPPSPIYGIKSLKMAQFTNQRMEQLKAFEYYTEGSAKIMCEEKKLGKIKKGLISDFVVLNNRIEDIGKKPVSVEATFKKGKQVFTKE
ncbi:MAG: hypothetical protein COX48_01530 [bacterium (Candidatus Stahlbacteria) CG23_combo_of_CG06-09_8_20_14_all_34_7]|nr:MAG: hypothetical protein COX48_01530 [bacterium (Candidatus Stahlbacteria) CG23_combo_of_CG06-09_8_20_14_all_34_7]